MVKKTAGRWRATASAWTAVTAVTLLVLTGCGSDAPSGRLATYDADGGMDSLLTGTVSIDDSCVTVDDGTTVHTPAFPGGAEMDGDVLRFHGAEYADGAKIELGGGEATDLSGVRIPKGCPSDHVFLVAPD